MLSEGFSALASSFFFFCSQLLSFTMDSFLDPFASPVPGKSRHSQPNYKPTADVNTSQLLALTPKPQSNISAFRSSTVSDAATLVPFNNQLRSSVKIAAERAVQLDVPQQAHVRPSTYPAATSHKLTPHGYRFSVDAPINYQFLFRSMTSGKKQGWPRSWLLRTPLLDPKIIVNPYHQLDDSVPLFQHTCATISSASSAKDNHSYVDDMDSVATPNSDGGIRDDYFWQAEGSLCSMQITLFALGFLLFPCWWIGGFYCRPQTSAGSVRSSCSSIDIKTSSWMTKALGGSLHKAQYRRELSYSQLFHLLNRAMALLSAIWMIVIISVVIWYYVGLSHGLWVPWDNPTVNGTRQDLLNRQSKFNIAT